MAHSSNGSSPPRICIIYASEDREIARNLVQALTSISWQAWCAENLGHGDWAKRVRSEIETADALIPLLSEHSRDKQVFADEWELAASFQKAIFPFALDTSGAPLGMGRYSRTTAHGWSGDLKDAGFIELVEKLRLHFQAGLEDVVRPSQIQVGKKTLALPSFVFSLSSFETQLNPTDGLELLADLMPPACLISAYDAKAHLRAARTGKFWRAVDLLRKSNSILFLDSGNYEAARNDNYKSPANIDGWSAAAFYEVATTAEADIVFTYDRFLELPDSVDAMVESVLKQYEQDMFRTGLGPETLCPILHFKDLAKDGGVAASEVVFQIAKTVRPSFIAIPERELGDGLLSRMHALKTIRGRLNSAGFYQPLHILGTGNPTTIAALSVCGADCFDGLEWCRTAANYETHNLLHFQQFDLLAEAFAGRMTIPAARALVELVNAPFALRAASYNFDYFCDWLKTIRSMIHSGQHDTLLRYIPSVGNGLVKGYRS